MTSMMTRLFSRAEYHRMAEIGLLSADDHVELLAGEIINLTPIGPRHAAVVNLLQRLFQDSLADEAIVRVQSPLVLDDASEPQPDLMLLAPRADYYRNAHPTPGDVLLLVEVASTSATFDRGPKLAHYAKAGVAEYWVIDLTRNVVIVHRRPIGEEYAELVQHQSGATIAPQVCPQATVAVSALLA